MQREGGGEKEKEEKGKVQSKDKPIHQGVKKGDLWDMRQRLKASEFKSEPRWDFEEEYSLDMSSLQTVSLDLPCDSALYHHPRQPFSSCGLPDT